MTSRIEAIRSYLTCDLENIDVHTLTQFHLKNSKTTRPYYNCTTKMKGICELKTCLPILYSACRAAKVTSVKTIRIQMTLVKPLLKKYPQLKIVHLVRDPRATLFSQHQVRNFEWTDLKEAAESLCSKISKNLRESEMISRTHPKRILTVRYDDLAENPIPVSKRIYDFLGMKFTDKIKEYIWNITQGGLPNGCVICTTRTNSTETAHKWRKRAKYDDVLLIDKVCSDVYKTMGYLRVPDRSVLRDMSFSFRKKWGNVNV